jgi:hypothetical protein
MILSSGERAVWAAVFAAELQAQLEDSRENAEEHEDYYDVCVSCGVESGCDAVKSLRRQTAEGWPGRPEDEVAMVRAMLGEE